MLKQTQEGVGVGKKSIKVDNQVRSCREAQFFFMSRSRRMLKLGNGQGGMGRFANGLEC